MAESLEYSSNVPPQPGSSSAMGAGARNGSGEPNMDPVGSPTREQYDPAPTRHAPTTENEQTFEKSKYETSTPFRSKKGDRFSNI